MLLAEPLAARVIGLAIEVHRHTGPGVLESVYELCLCRELADAGIAFARQVTIPILYKGAEVGDGFKADIVVAGEPSLSWKSRPSASILPTTRCKPPNARQAGALYGGFLVKRARPARACRNRPRHHHPTPAHAHSRLRLT